MNEIRRIIIGKLETKSKFSNQADKFYYEADIKDLENVKNLKDLYEKDY